MDGRDVESHRRMQHRLAGARQMVSLPGRKNPNWKGGRTIASNGYVLVKVGPSHHLADIRGYAYEHRVNAEIMLGRPLAKGERVKFRNGDTTDTSFSNLIVKAKLSPEEKRASNITATASRFQRCLTPRRK